MSHRVLNVLVAQVCLQRPRIMPSVRQCITTGMSKHVRVNYEVEACTFANPLNQPINGTGREWPTTFSLEHECAGRIPL